MRSSGGTYAGSSFDPYLSSSIGPARSSREQQQYQQQPPQDEFDSTFRAHPKRAIDRRGNSGRRTGGGTAMRLEGFDDEFSSFGRTNQSSSTAGLLTQQQQPLFNDGSDMNGRGPFASPPPPTASLSSLLHSTAAPRAQSASVFSSAASAGAASAQFYSTPFGCEMDSADSSASSSRATLLAGLSPGGLDISGAFASLVHLIGAQEQFRFRAWLLEVHTWRLIAAAVWYGVSSLCILHLFSLGSGSAPSLFPGVGIGGGGWGWFNPLAHLFAWVMTSPLVTKPLVAVWFIGLQVCLLWVRAGQSTTDSSALAVPVVPRLFRAGLAATNLRAFFLAAAALGLSGWCACEVLFVESDIWTVDPAAAVAAAGGAAASAPVPAATQSTAFLVSGFLCYTAWSSFNLAFGGLSGACNLLTFPSLYGRSRLRLLSSTLSSLVLAGAWEAARFVVAFTAAVWPIWGPTVVGMMARLEQVVERMEEQKMMHHQHDPDAAPTPTTLAKTIASAASAATASTLASTVGSASVTLLPSLAALYHLFLLLLLLSFLAFLQRRFLSVFLTQPLDVGSNGSRAQAGVGATSGGGNWLLGLFGQLNVDGEAGATAESVDGPASPGGINRAASSASSSESASSTHAALRPHLTRQLILRYLDDLATMPQLAQERNAMLFGDDMNRLVAAGGDGSGQDGSGSGLTELPRQPGFVALFTYALASIHAMAERLTRQRLLVTSPSSAADIAGGAMDVGSVTGLDPLRRGEFDELLSSPLALPTPAFLSTVLDGAGLFFPSRAQQTKALLHDAKEVELLLRIVSTLAAHARQLSAGVGVSSASGHLVGSTWLEPLLEHLVVLSVSLDAYVHAAHFISPMQERHLQGHQLTRTSCLSLAATIDQALYRTVAAYRDYLPELHLSQIVATRLQTYAAFGN